MLRYGHGLLGARELEIVAENMVVAQLELGHAVLLLLFPQKFLQAVLAMFHKVEQFVELSIVAGTEDAAVSYLSRERVAERTAQQVGHIVHHVPAFDEPLEPRGQF